MTIGENKSPKNHPINKKALAFEGKHIACETNAS
jgi:hypothetical protein